jgi:hypothetical protein
MLETVMPVDGWVSTGDIGSEEGGMFVTVDV